MQGEHSRIRWVGMLQGSIIVAWMIALWWLSRGVGEEALLARFIRRDLWWMVYVANAIFVSFAASLAVKWPRHAGPGNMRSLVQGGILLLPLLFLPLATTSDLSIQAAVKRSLYTSRASVSGYKSREASAVDTDEMGQSGNMRPSAPPVKSPSVRGQGRSLGSHGAEGHGGGLRREDAIPRASSRVETEQPPDPQAVKQPRERPTRNSTPAVTPPKHREPTMFDLVTKPEDFEGMNVTLVGRVHQDKRLHSDSFYCYRMLMICCAADATPAGVVVKWKGSPKITTGTWVKVSGKAGFITFEGGPYPAVAAVKVERTNPPKNRFIVPN